MECFLAFSDCGRLCPAVVVELVALGVQAGFSLTEGVCSQVGGDPVYIVSFLELYLGFSHRFMQSVRVVYTEADALSKQRSDKKMDCHMGGLAMHISEEKHSVVRS